MGNQLNIYLLALIAICASYAIFKYVSPPSYHFDNNNNNNNNNNNDHFSQNIIRNEDSVSNSHVLVLTILKDEKSWGNNRSFIDHLRIIESLNYTSSNLSLGFLVSDESEFQKLNQQIKVNELESKFRHITLIKKDFPQNINREERHDYRIQRIRRNLIARARNMLLMSSLKDESYVLWIDADIIKLPDGILHKMIRSGKDIITPRCRRGSMEDYDLNAWQGPRFRKSPTPQQVQAIDQGATFVPDQVPGITKHLGDFKKNDPLMKNEFVKLDSVGGTVLFVKSDVHKQGVIFPTEYIVGTTWNRFGFDGIETEGLCYLAKTVGATCWGMPHEEAIHDSS